MRIKIRILFISPYPIFPLHYGGKIRIYQMALNLSKLNFDITIIAPHKMGQPSFLQINKNLKIYSIKYPFVLPFLLTNRPFSYPFLISFHPGYRFIIKRFLQRFDIYQFEHASFSDLIDHIPQEKIIVYNAHNVEYDYVKSECRSKFIRNLSLKRIHDFEKKIISRSTSIFVCSEEDKNRLIELYGACKDKFFVVPNGIQQIFHKKLRGKYDIIREFPGLKKFKKKALFCGSDVKHNRAAVEFIVNQLAPQLKKECAFIIKGGCGRSFQKNKMSNVFISPEDDNVELFVAASTVAINPILQGSGTSFKMLFYLANRLPVVSTEFGARGYRDLKPFITISEIKKFAISIRKNQYFPIGVEEVLKKYLWSRIALKTKDIYQSLAQKNG